MTQEASKIKVKSPREKLYFDKMNLHVGKKDII
jgi:hypothetical protein